ncbi:hypothetical protein chiPu_0027178, partial [Chiloscyllium punctatum]|nr:hypothetical protein [Chiloscyllium punctatum]
MGSGLERSGDGQWDRGSSGAGTANGIGARVERGRPMGSGLERSG